MGKSIFDETICFPNITGEALLATAYIIGESKIKVQAKIWLVDGHIFSLTFNKPPKILCATSNLKTLSHLIVNTKIVNDPKAVIANNIDALINAVLPSDYDDSIKNDAITINGKLSIREIVLYKDNYYILAEFNGGVIAVRSGGDDGALYLLRYEDESIEPLGNSFIKAIEKISNFLKSQN
jgi:hypothetical protein